MPKAKPTTSTNTMELFIVCDFILFYVAYAYCAHIRTHYLINCELRKIYTRSKVEKQQKHIPYIVQLIQYLIIYYTCKAQMYFLLNASYMCVCEKYTKCSLLFNYSNARINFHKQISLGQISLVFI